jgi:hypothetical protein
MERRCIHDQVCRTRLWVPRNVYMSRATIQISSINLHCPHFSLGKFATFIDDRAIFGVIHLSDATKSIVAKLRTQHPT